jgi:amidohydrolase
VDFYDVVVKGKGGHGARPHETVDTIFAAAQVVQAIYQVQNIFFSSLENPTVLSVGRIQGGTAHNIIPQTCTISGTFRTFADADRVKMRTLITKAAEETCRLYGADCDVQITPNAPPVINDASLGRLIESVVEDVFGKNAIEHLKFPMTASEDFAYYREKCPIYFLRIGVSSGPETSFPLHHSKFNIDENVICHTVELMSHVVLRYLEK